MTDRRAALEAAIEDDPYDPRGYAVLGDYLQEIGDPRGELIALQLGGRKGAMEHAAGEMFASLHADLTLPSGVDFRWVDDCLWHRGRRRADPTDSNRKGTSSEPPR